MSLQISTLQPSSPTQLAPIMPKEGEMNDFWENKARKKNLAIREIVDSYIKVIDLTRIVLDYCGTNLTTLSLNAAILRAKNLYGLFIQNQYILLEWQTNRSKKLNGVKEIVFMPQETAEPVFSIEEQEPVRVILDNLPIRLMQYETTFGPTKKLILKFPHLTLDNRRKYSIHGNFDPTDKIEFWLMSGPKFEDKLSLVFTQTCDGQVIVNNTGPSSLPPKMDEAENDEEGKQNLLSPSSLPANNRISPSSLGNPPAAASDNVDSISAEIERLCDGTDPKKFARLFIDYVSQQSAIPPLQLLNDLRKMKK